MFFTLNVSFEGEKNSNLVVDLKNCWNLFHFAGQKRDQTMNFDFHGTGRAGRLIAENVKVPWDTGRYGTKLIDCVPCPTLIRWHRDSCSATTEYIFWPDPKILTKPYTRLFQNTAMSRNTTIYVLNSSKNIWKVRKNKKKIIFWILDTCPGQNTGSGLWEVKIV